MFTLIVFGVLALFVLMAVSTFKTSRNSRLPEEVKMQRYQAKEAAKANTGGAIVMFVMIGFVIYAVARAFGVDPGQAPQAVVTSSAEQGAIVGEMLGKEPTDKDITNKLNNELAKLPAH